MPETQDERVVQAVGGDRAILSALLTEHGAVVRGRLAGQIPRRWQSVLSLDDVLQETYTDAILDIRRLIGRTEAAFGAWLMTLARRNLCDAIRMLDADKRGGGRQPVGVGGSDESAAALHEILCDSCSTASRAAARTEAAAALLRAVEGLPASYQLVVRQYDLECRPVEEVAAGLGRSPGAVFMLRSRAHRRLRELLGVSSDYLSASA